jgi:hypothetical protein
MRLMGALAGMIAMLGTGMAAAQTPQAASTPSPEVVTTGTLANLCAASGTDAQSATATGFCRGFLIGAGQYHAALSAPGGLRPVFCLPSPTPQVEAAQAGFVAWAAANPQHAGDRAVDGLTRWAAATYPCPPAPAAPRRAGQR